MILNIRRILDNFSITIQEVLQAVINRKILNSSIKLLLGAIMTLFVHKITTTLKFVSERLEWI